MTEKQLLKRLQYQQNKLLDVKGYSFYLSYSDALSINRYFNIYIGKYTTKYKYVCRNL